MGKKIDDSEPKKECPSCGLGVALDATICEFCGWDFDEEDEWILQIEKLERDLMLEKQKFPAGTVDERIESSLHTPAFDRIEMIKSNPRTAPQPATPGQRAKSVPEKPVERKASAVRPEPIAAPAVREETRAPAPMQVPGSQPSGKVRRVRSAKPTNSPAQAAPANEQGQVRRTRTVRKVKQ